MNDFPLTRYLCALIDVKEGRIAIGAVRERWKQGEFEGVRAGWAKAYAEQFGIKG